jgi:site-specific DNA-methyltransferase (adenine-specific)
MLLLEDSINKIICADCLEIMRQIPNGMVDLIVTSLPYNLKNSSGNVRWPNLSRLKIRNYEI